MADNNDVDSKAEHVVGTPSPQIEDKKSITDHITASKLQIDLDDRNSLFDKSSCSTLDINLNSETKILPENNLKKRILEFGTRTNVEAVKSEAVHHVTMNILSALSDDADTAATEILAHLVDEVGRKKHSILVSNLPVLGNKPKSSELSEFSKQPHVFLEASKQPNKIFESKTQHGNLLESSMQTSNLLESSMQTSNLSELSTQPKDIAEPSTSLADSEKWSNKKVETTEYVDIFGYSLTSRKHLLKMIVPCPHCGRKVGATVFAFHLSRCMKNNDRRCKYSTRK